MEVPIAEGEEEVLGEEEEVEEEAVVEEGLEKILEKGKGGHMEEEKVA